MKTAGLIVLGALIGTLIAHMFIEYFEEDDTLQSPYYVEDTLTK